MNYDKILKTAITYWSDEDEGYVTCSHLADTICAFGDTPEDSKKLYKTFLKEEYKAYKEGRHAIYRKPGRPTKNTTRIETKLSPEYKDKLVTLAEELDLSYGEVMEYLIAFFEAVKKAKIPT